MIHILLNNGLLDFVNIEQQEASYISYGVGFKNPNFAVVAEAMGGVKRIRIEEPDVAHKSGPLVVDVVVDPYALGPPSHVPFHTCQTGAKRQDVRSHPLEYKSVASGERLGEIVGFARILAFAAPFSSE